MSTTQRDEVIRHAQTLDSPSWKFWVNRKAAVEKLISLGSNTEVERIIALGRIVSMSRIEMTQRKAAAECLVKLETAALPALPQLIELMKRVCREAEDIPSHPIQSVLDAVGAMGSEARSAIPTLVSVVETYATRFASGLSSLITGSWVKDRPTSPTAADGIMFAMGKVMPQMLVKQATEAAGKILGRPWTASEESAVDFIRWWQADGNKEQWATTGK